MKSHLSKGAKDWAPGIILSEVEIASEIGRLNVGV
jgi:hypothetical protein